MDDLAGECSQKTVENTPSRLNTTQSEGRRRNKDIKQKKSSTESPNGKPWRKPGADITDYFNYGFTEESWEAYRQKHRKMRAAIRTMTSWLLQTFRPVDQKKQKGFIMRSGGHFT